MPGLFFDFINWLVPNGSSSELSDFVAQPEQFRLHYLDTVLLWTDQIPVWLKVDAGSQLVSESRLKAVRAGGKQRKHRRQLAKLRLSALADSTEGGLPAELPAEAEGEQGESYLAKGPGDVDASRWRVTLIARQAVLNYWNPAKVPEGAHWVQKNSC